MSLDGFINDGNSSAALLYPDLKELGQTEMMQESIRTTGAVVMGRKTFDMASDPDSYADSYEFQVPILSSANRHQSAHQKKMDVSVLHSSILWKLRFNKQNKQLEKKMS